MFDLEMQQWNLELQQQALEDKLAQERFEREVNRYDQQDQFDQEKLNGLKLKLFGPDLNKIKAETEALEALRKLYPTKRDPKTEESYRQGLESLMKSPFAQERTKEEIRRRLEELNHEQGQPLALPLGSK